MVTFRHIAFAVCALCSCATFAKVEWVDVTALYIKNPSYANNNGDYWLGTELNFDGAVSNASHFHKRMTLFDANSSLFHAESTFPRKSCESTLSFELTA